MHTDTDLAESLKSHFQTMPVLTNLLITVIAISIGSNKPLQTVKTQIRRHRTRNLIRVYTVCHTYSNILDTSTGI